MKLTLELKPDGRVVCTSDLSSLAEVADGNPNVLVRELFKTLQAQAEQPLVFDSWLACVAALARFPAASVYQTLQSYVARRS